MSTITNLNDLVLSGGLTAAGAITALAGVVGGITFPVQQLTASGAFNNVSQLMQLNHATVIIAATLGDPVPGQFIIIWDDSASGTAAHTVTLNNATWDGTHKIATFAAPGKALVCVADSATRYDILVNLGTVAFS